MRLPDDRVKLVIELPAGVTATWDDTGATYSLEIPYVNTLDASAAG